MAGHVALSQALSYARDLKSLYEASQARERDLGTANARLRAAHRQSLRYAGDLKKTYRRMEGTFLQSLLALANALEARDPYTRGHSERVATWARRLALAGGLPTAMAESIAQAGLLHDLGKIGVPELVLRKTGPLTEAEWEIMRQHPVTGARILAPLEFFGDGAVIVRHHHERHDGSGYPDGLRGESIPLGARIVAVADVYDALRSERPYRVALSHEETVRRMHLEAGRTLDADLTARFIDLAGDASAQHPV
ncbi:MAG TPA: HD-GYP domain-containing protein [Candidatus Limnocylindrales bacterium]|nr:HD-GYP domain-containing protein [Candidatus Limnocylindrales bacterium]